MTIALNLSDLAHFTGSENAFFHPLFRAIKYTDGVKFVGDNGASWLVTDILAVCCGVAKVKREPFVVVTFTAKGGKGAIVWDDGNDNKLHRQNVDFTDFPDGKIKFYVENNVLMLVSER
jgi:hypothetical protein